MPDFNRYGSIIDFQNRTNAPMGAISYKEPLTKGGHLCKRLFVSVTFCRFGLTVTICGYRPKLICYTRCIGDYRV